MRQWAADLSRTKYNEKKIPQKLMTSIMMKKRDPKADLLGWVMESTGGLEATLGKKAKHLQSSEIRLGKWNWNYD
jgi:hypothetical protein